MMKGKEYIVEDGDIIFFKFNKPNPPKKKWIIISINLMYFFYFFFKVFLVYIYYLYLNIKVLRWYLLGQKK